MSTAPRPSKHATVYAWLHKAIGSGRLKPGARLPSEAELVRQFGVSRITASRAVRDLQAAGLVERRVGAGTFVAEARRPTAGLSFGLLIPDLGETEVFEPMCQGMMASPLARDHALMWGSAISTSIGEDRAWQLCRQFIDRRVDGVFFAPLEMTPARDDVNHRIAEAFDAAGIPIVLLDRPLTPYPDPGHHDLVGIDNRHAGYVITHHLLSRGCRRVAFVGLPDAALTVDAREAGYREALHAASAQFDRAWVQRIDPGDAARVQALMNAHQPDGIVCANDRTAGLVMKALIQLGHQVPRDVRLVGIDDAGYATLLPVPLSTLRQPTRQIGDTALMVMLERIARRDLPPRETRLHGELVVRDSSV
jgi:GntR family transcriptional regulator of arabinose operon